MAPKRGNTLPPPDLLSPNSPLPSPRSASPSSGFTHFLSKPSKWFSRSASASKPPSTNYEPRPSLSGGRKHKISHPTDPRPILDNHAGAASRYVVRALFSTCQFLTCLLPVLSLIYPFGRRGLLSCPGFMALVLALVPLLGLGTLETSQGRGGLNLLTTWVKFLLLNTLLSNLPSRSA